jgi:hypothetical protein
MLLEKSIIPTAFFCLLHSAKVHWWWKIIKLDFPVGISGYLLPDSFLVIFHDKNQGRIISFYSFRKE